VTGNECANGSAPKQPEEREDPHSPEEREPAPDEPEGEDTEPAAGDDTPDGGELAETGTGPGLISILPLGAGLLLGGVVLYRRRGPRPAHRG
jgi:hypothetical protein